MDGQQFDKFVQALGRGMNRRGVLGSLAGLAAGAVGARVVKADSNRPTVAEFCRELDDAGTLAFLAVTRGECVNIFARFVSGGRVNERANNFIAAVCGIDEVYVRLKENHNIEVSNKGQCIKAVRALGLTPTP